MSELYVYLCNDCDTLNHIHWNMFEWHPAPYCCECGQNKFEHYKFVTVLEAKVKDAD